MPLILRLDVDKPYGNAGLVRRVMSKLSEDMWFPVVRPLYLKHLAEFIRYCNTESIPAIFYHRHSTVPTAEVIRLYEQGGHQVGFHAENTRTFETFSNELAEFKRKVGGLPLHSFTKHGSGFYKLGKNHYPPYEPGKYLQWSRQVKIPFLFGNGIASSPEDLAPKEGFFPNMFWIESEYRHPEFATVAAAVSCARDQKVPVLLHPCNFQSSSQARNDFFEMVRLSRKMEVKWVTI